MYDYPKFMKDKRNAVDEGDPNSGVEGYVYDGADGSQMIHWTCKKEGVSEEHKHEYDEYMVVVSGRYEITIGKKKTILSAGDEYYVPKGTMHAGRFFAGTRTIHAFGGQRACRRSI